MSYDLNLVIWSLFRLWRSLDYPFPWTMSWEMMQEAYLKDSIHKKLCFGALETRFEVKKPNFCELRAKLGHLRFIKAGELTWWTISLVYAMENVDRGRFKTFQTSEKYILGLQKVNLGSKKANFWELWAKFGHLRSFQAVELILWIIWNGFEAF